MEYLSMTPEEMPGWIVALILSICGAVFIAMFWDDGFERIWFRFRCKWFGGYIVHIPGMAEYALWRCTASFEFQGRHQMHGNQVFALDPANRERLRNHLTMAKLQGKLERIPSGQFLAGYKPPKINVDGYYES